MLVGPSGGLVSGTVRRSTASGGQGLDWGSEGLGSSHGSALTG